MVRRSPNNGGDPENPGPPPPFVKHGSQLYLTPSMYLYRITCIVVETRSPVVFSTT